jgi:hypothetical protein
MKEKERNEIDMKFIGKDRNPRISVVGKDKNPPVTEDGVDLSGIYVLWPKKELFLKLPRNSEANTEAIIFNGEELVELANDGFTSNHMLCRSLARTTWDKMSNDERIEDLRGYTEEIVDLWFILKRDPTYFDSHEVKPYWTETVDLVKCAVMCKDKDDSYFVRMMIATFFYILIIQNEECDKTTLLEVDDEGNCVSIIKEGFGRVIIPNQGENQTIATNPSSMKMSKDVKKMLRDLRIYADPPSSQHLIDEEEARDRRADALRSCYEGKVV